MALLLVLQHDPPSVARLESALRSEHDLRRCSSWTGLWDAVATQPVDGCVLDIYDPAHPVGHRDLQRLRQRQPPLAIVVYADFKGRELDLFELGRLNIDGVILAGRSDDPKETRRAINQSLAAAVALRVAGALEGRLHPLALSCLRWGIEHTIEDPGVPELAASVGLNARGLARELRRHELPPPRRILLWARLFHAARILDDGHTVEEVALNLGYSSAAALGRAFRREVGFPPTDVMRRGGVACVLERFQRVRRTGRERRRPSLTWTKGGAEG